jgi:cell division protein FtsL
MNASAKSLVHGRSLVSDRLVLARDAVGVVGEEQVALWLPELRVIILLVMVLISALSLIYIKDLNRRLFVDFQNSQAVYVQLQNDAEELELRQSTWARQSRVQQLAEQEYAMQLPVSQDVVTLSLP